MRKKKKEIFIEDLKIEEAGSEGVSIGRYDNTVVFVPFVVPGDVVDVNAIKKRKSFYQAKVVEIKTYSPHRTNPLCSHFGICGGCKWQQMSYEKQLYYKQKQVKDNFERIGKFPFPEIEPIIPSDKTFEYRNKVEYTFSNRRWLTVEELEKSEELEKRGLGFHLSGMFDKILDIETCFLHSQIGNEIRNAVKKYAIEQDFTFWNARAQEGCLRNMIIRSSTKGELMVILVFKEYNKKTEALLQFLSDKFPQITSLMYVVNTKQNDTISDLDVILFSGKEYMMEQMSDLKFKISPLAFYQTNAEQALKLYQKVKEFAQITPSDVVYDLYTGTGTIALFVAKEAEKVVGIEYVESAVEDAKENALLNRISNTSFVAGDMAKIFTDEFVAQHKKPNVVITDPPRSGMHPDVIQQILKIAPQKIVYVSCNPATQARDVALMKEQYDVARIQPVDMFPQTHHVENVVLLEKR